MKKTIIIISIIISLLVINKEEEIIIPEESIRFRIIANSNTKEDQRLKKEIVKNLNKVIINKDIKNITEERKYLKENIGKFQKIVDKTIKDNNSISTFNINYGMNYFPEKKYQNVTYPEGEYESLVITLGEGNGHNFWCVLFPPLCLIDEKEENYPSLIQDLINKYF